MKQICNTRGNIPTIHQNLFLDSTEPQNQKARVQYKSGDSIDTVTWENQEFDSNILKAVHIFDTKSASSYIEDEDEIAFIPSELFIIEKLASACSQVEEKIRAESQQLSFQEFDYSFLKTEESNEIQSFLESLSAKSDLKKLEEIAIFTVDDDKLLKATEEKIIKLKALDPSKKIVENNKVITRLNILKTKYEQINNALLTEKIGKIKKNLLEEIELQKAIGALTKKTFTNLPLEKIGSDPWKRLWESAKSFYEHSTHQKFPNLSENSTCPLCLQDLNDEAKIRFTNFEEFIQTDIQIKLNTVSQSLTTSKQEIQNINIDFSEIQSTIFELNNIVENFAELHNEIIKKIHSYISSILESFTNPQKVSELLEEEINIDLIFSIKEVVAKIEEENKKLLEKSVETEIKEQDKVFSLLKSKKGLFENKEKIEKEIKRQKSLETLNLCRQSCSTRNISLLSNSLSEKYITNTLKENFTGELEKLGFRNIKITTSTRGSSGKQFHSLTLDSSYGNNIALKDILSEGEHRCISLSTFFSELSVCEHKSAIIFDDPVSSLDHKWRRKIAKRIVEESSQRQVIVFTHDITFLMNLQEFLEDINIQSLTRKPQETGISSKNPPWDALTTNKRVGILKQALQQLEKSERTETEKVYKEEVKVFYGKLRETWERCVEEVVLNGVVQRFGRSIETKKLKNVIHFSEDDYRIIDDNMVKCSRYFNGHDSAGALIEEMPTSNEIKIDVENLESFKNEIRGRQ